MEKTYDARTFFSEKKAHPLVLDLLLTRTFGVDWHEWEPETLRSEILQQLGAIHPVNWSMVQATRTVHTNPAMAFDHWEVCLPILLSFNNVMPDFDVLCIPTVPQIYTGVDVLLMLDPEETFSIEVTRFLATCFLSRGVYYAPDNLSFIQDRLRRSYYKCKDCKNIEWVDEDFDGVCDSCGRDWTKSAVGVTLKEPNTTLKHTHDEASVKARFEQAMQNPDDFLPHDDIPEDVQTAKLMMAIAYRDHRREEMKEQMACMGLTSL